VGLQHLGDSTLAEQFLDVVVALSGAAFEDALDVVAVRAVTDVVEDGRGSHALGLHAADFDVVERAVGEVVDAQGVLEARVVRRRVDEVDRAQLLDAAEPLDGRRVHQVRGDAPTSMWSWTLSLMVVIGA